MTDQDILIQILGRAIQAMQPWLAGVEGKAKMTQHNGMPYPYSVHGNVIFCPFRPMRGK